MVQIPGRWMKNNILNGLNYAEGDSLGSPSFKFSRCFEN